MKHLFNFILPYFLIFAFTLFLTVGYSQVSSKKRNTQQEECLVPVIYGSWIHAYQPRGDIFSGPGIQDLEAGKYYSDWHSNDHCFVKGPDNRWHAFGITRPAAKPGERVSHAGEYVSFHAVSPGESFEHSFREDAWKDTTKVLPPSQRPGETPSNHAPTIVKHEGTYKMIYGPRPFRMAVSKDLYNWEPQGPLDINEKKSGRDPSLMLWEGTYYLTYCSGNVVKTTTSKDLVNWSEPVEIFKAKVESYHCESPTLLRHNDTFYLFWCLWDTAVGGNGFGERTFVYCSDNPLDFHGQPLLTELTAHAPEIIQGDDNRWYISSAQYPSRGVNVARLIWK